ncbi:hypothetical protein Tco_0740084 [Tanacetum coccineum]
MENLNLFYQDIGISSSTGRHLIQEEEAKEALLGLYHAEELDKDGFDVYFQGGLRSDDHFNAQETTGYDKIQKNDLWLLSMFDAGQQNGYANMAWFIARWIKRKGAGTQKESHICCRQFIIKLARKSRVLSDEFGAPIYGPKPAAYLNCNDPAERSLAPQAVINPFRKISVWKKAVSFLGSLPVPLQHVNWKPDYKGCYTNKEEAKGQWRTKIRNHQKLHELSVSLSKRENLICYGQFITKLARKSRVLSDETDSEAPQSDVPRVAIPRAQRASMQDLYERMVSMEIRQGTIKRMAYRQSHHWDRYARVFEHMVGVYNVPLQRAYNPPGYAQPQYDQYYQQYPLQQ